nr:carboxypeptidase-like regulatory domain-containing protein [bacterium]
AYRHLTYSAEYTATEEGPNETDIILENIPVGVVEGTITDERGDPIDDVLVNATQPNVDPFTYTDASGHYRIENVPAGTWIISGYKQGYLTVNKEVEITDGGVAHVSLQLASYTPPPATLIPFTGRILDSTKFDDQGRPSSDAGIGGADIVFTPVDNNYGHYVQHKNSDSSGNYGVGLINNLDYNLLIQAPGFQDMFTRIWVDSQWPMFDYSLWLVGVHGGWNGGGVAVPGGTIDPSTGDGGGSPDSPPPPG